MMTFTDWDILRNLLLAARWTLLLSLVAFLGGTLVTLPLLLLLLLLRLSRRRWPVRLVRGYAVLFQGTPLLMQLFLAFFGLGLFGIDVSPWTAAALALTLFTSAFLVDIWFGSIDALPKGLLCDEITSALDPELVGEVLKVLEQLAKEGITLVLVTHEMNFAREVGDRVIFMHQGKVWEQGESRALFAHPQTPELQQFIASVRGLKEA